MNCNSRLDAADAILEATSIQYYELSKLDNLVNDFESLRTNDDDLDNIEFDFDDGDDAI